MSGISWTMKLFQEVHWLVLNVNYHHLILRDKRGYKLQLSSPISAVDEWGFAGISSSSFQWFRETVLFCSFGHGSSLLWTHALRPFVSRPNALAQEGRSLVNDVCECRCN